MYNYETEKPKILTDEGQKRFLKTRDYVNALLDRSGAVMMGDAMGGPDSPCSSWEAMAYVDRMVELGEIEEVGAPASCGQARIFARPVDLKHPRFR